LSHYFYDARIPALANDFVKEKLVDASPFLAIAQSQDAGVTLGTLKTFSEQYLNALSKSYHYGFGVACLSLIISMLIFWGFRRHYSHADLSEKQKSKSEALRGQVVELTPQETRERLVVLGLVFFVVIFFWMAFQESAVTMTYFARDYTVPAVGKLTNLWFDLTGLLAVFMSAIGLVFLLKKNSGSLSRAIGGVAFAGFAVLGYLRFRGYLDINPFQPQRFQHFNPFFIVALTPIIIGIFGLRYSRRRLHGPSQPKVTRRPGCPSRFAGLGLLADLDIFSADDRRAFLKPYRHLLCFQGCSTQI
jgi:POT family proton-dependent oligopeptide transporter